MRGGKLYIKGDVGYRVGIHMKEYKKQVPIIIAAHSGRLFRRIHGRRDNDPSWHEWKSPLVGDYVGTGMHGGVCTSAGRLILSISEKK